MKEWKKNLYAFLFFIIVMSIAIRGHLKYRERFETGIKVPAVVHSGVQNMRWYYEVEGRMYEGKMSMSNFSHLIDGEKYYVYYEPDDPEVSSIAFTEPVVDTVLFDSVYSLPFEGKFKKGSRLVKFKYVIADDTLSRYNRFYFTSDFKSSGERFIVYYKISDPKISYINFRR